MEMHINSEPSLLKLYKLLDQHGKKISPRGETTYEIENFTYNVAPGVRFNNFTGRNLNLDYIKREMAWYIHADPRDLSITEHAAQWGRIVANGKLNSNYGSYWFGKYGVRHVVQLLQNDPSSRRAVIPMYGTDTDHMDIEAKDVPCTLSIGFRIRDHKVNAHAIMRSQDILWGMGNDLPTFSILHEIVARLLDLPMGILSVHVGSFHVYESRMSMFKNIIDKAEYRSIKDKPPNIERLEAEGLIRGQINPQFAFSQWLLNLDH
jgi:thymidylate synthase